MNCRRLKVAYLPADLSGELRKGLTVPQTVLLPAAKTVVGEAPLAQLRALREVALPEGLRAVGAHWFSCSAVEAVRLPRSVREVKTAAFARCDCLSRLEIPADAALKEIGTQAFRWCMRLHSVELPTGLETLGMGCFQDSGLEEITVPAGVRQVREAAFLCCSQLCSAAFAAEGRLRRVREYAFAGTLVRRVELPRGVKVDRGAFPAETIVCRPERDNATADL